MDDVWVVIGLLLFGSLLFCLCCYKVTNLLYMLYHIDDTTESLTGNDLATAVTNSAAGAMGALPIALALVPSAVDGKRTESTEPIVNMNHSSTPSLYPLEKVGKTNSVTSLSVGVQYDPRDVRDERPSRHQRYSPVDYIPANGLRRHHHHQQQKTHFHLSAPDFSRGYPQPQHPVPPAPSELPGRRHSGHSRRSGGQHHEVVSSMTGHQHHHHHHLHHKSASIARTLSTPSREILDHGHRQQMAPTAADYEAYFGSLGRSNHFRTYDQQPPHLRSRGSLSESDPEGLGQHWPPINSPQPHPPPMKSARLSSSDVNMKRASSARRYGSIRVAECRFVEADSPQPQSDTPPASVCDIKSSYNRQYSLKAGYYSSLPPPPSSPSPNIHRSSRQQPMCNGPMSIGLARPSYLNGSGNGQHSHIIPPPHNFSGSNTDYAPLTTTRIGSAINLSTASSASNNSAIGNNGRASTSNLGHHDHHHQHWSDLQPRTHSPPF